jgi:site-specific DNA-methyltransferase (adenine-specific)
MKKYNIIYADPPWEYRNQSINHTDGKALAFNHYKTLSVEEICKIKVGEIADKNCALFIWVTFPNLPEVFRVIKHWGFTYKTVAFVWVKTTKNKKLFMGTGYYTRANSEICLLATRGTVKPISHSIHSILLFPILGHSRKPNEIRKRIVELFGDLPRIELFSRMKWDGWDSWGNEVINSIELT